MLQCPTMMAVPLSGALTFLFTELEASTWLWEKHPSTMRVALARHNALLRSAIEGNQGQVIKTTGDGLHAVFASAHAGVNTIVAAQRALPAAPWPETGMALHTGEAALRDGDYYGPTLNRAARLLSLAAMAHELECLAFLAVAADRMPRAARLLRAAEALREMTGAAMTSTERLE
jgi:class 3 adenylate cyclase